MNMHAQPVKAIWFHSPARENIMVNLSPVPLKAVSSVSSSTSEYILDIQFMYCFITMVGLYLSCSLLICLTLCETCVCRSLKEESQC